MALTQELEGVQQFWNTEACGTHFIEGAASKKEFYDEYVHFRYRTAWHIPELIPFGEANGKKVLEIGCGNGADAVQFAKNGALYTGVDLTDAAINATREHFSLHGLGGQFQIENAEKLSFDNEAFDMVYSHGVLHHTQTPANAFAEVLRVLKPGGKAVIMLYHKHSFNYLVRIMTYMRARVLMKIATRAFRWKKDRQEIKDGRYLALRDNRQKTIYQAHYENFLRQGWRYLSPSRFVHHCTDGPDCPYAYVYSRKDVEKAFSAFSSVETKVAHFPLRKYPGLNRIPRSFEKFLARRMGFHLIVFATK